MQKKTSSWGYKVQIIIILIMALVLVIYVGFGEAYMNYPRFKIESAKALSEIIKNSVENFLNAGLPLKQYIGFSSLASPVIDSEEAIINLSIINEKEEVLFSVNKRGVGFDQNESLFESKLSKKDDQFLIQESASFYQLLVPLNSKFETESVGYVQVLIQKAIIQQEINPRFIPVYICLALVILVFSIIVILTANRKKRRLWINIAYTLSFLVTTIVIISVLINIYAFGIQGKSAALARSLEERLNSAFQLGLSIEDFSYLDETFLDYKTLNPEIDYIALTRENLIKIHTNKNFINQQQEISDKYIQHTITLLDNSTNLSIGNIHVGILKGLIYRKMFRNIKNFIVLFIASGFLAALFLNLVFSINEHKKLKSMTTVDDPKLSDVKVDLIRPLFFLGVFIEGIHASFLPQYFQEITQLSGVDVNLTSILFTAFFLFYGLIMIPGGRFADFAGVKSLLFGSIVLVTGSILAMTFTQNFYLMLIIRAVAGLGQGGLLIGTQYYILHMAHAERQTRGNSLIVIEYCGGRLSGTALGALLTNYIGINGVFLAGSGIGFLVIIYTLIFIPHIVASEEEKKEKKPSLLAGIGQMLKDPVFFKATFFIGIASKIVISGAIIFGFPLLMAGMNFPKEDIGQILMFYNAGVLIASIYAGKIVDRSGEHKKFLFWATMASAIPLLAIGLLDYLGEVYYSVILVTLTLIAGVFIMGFSHGFINAPVITYITQTKTSQALGKTSISLFRSMERIGQVFGPILISQLLLVCSQGTIAYYIMGIITIIFGLLFVIGKRYASNT
ncbi:MAG: MFS transporter [Spirochaetes bacterium]|nr:MFS transporter [Spirochaetota bacterium]